MPKQDFFQSMPYLQCAANHVFLPSNASKLPSLLIWSDFHQTDKRSLHLDHFLRSIVGRVTIRKHVTEFTNETVIKMLL